jgi:hypothetical protein
MLVREFLPFGAAAPILALAYVHETLLGQVISSSQGLCLFTSTEKRMHTQTPNVHALSGIRTHDPSFRASEDSACLRPLSYRDRLWYVYTVFKTIILDLVYCELYNRPEVAAVP